MREKAALPVDKQAVTAHYMRGATLRECALKFGVSMQRVHQIVRQLAPAIMRRPHIVPTRRHAGGRRKARP